MESRYYDSVTVDGEPKLAQVVRVVGDAAGSEVAAITVTKDEAVPVGTTSTALAAANPLRTSLLVMNTGDVDVFIASGGPATTTKLPLRPGDTLTINHTQAVNGIVASGTGTVYVIEEAR